MGAPRRSRYSKSVRWHRISPPLCQINLCRVDRPRPSGIALIAREIAHGKASLLKVAPFCMALLSCNALKASVEAPPTSRRRLIALALMGNRFRHSSKWPRTEQAARRIIRRRPAWLSPIGIGDSIYYLTINGETSSRRLDEAVAGNWAMITSGRHGDAWVPLANRDDAKRRRPIIFSSAH